MSRQIRRRPRRCRCGHVLVGRGVEAGDVGLVEGGLGDEGDVGAGVEGLVLRAVEVGGVLDLDGGVGARDDGGLLVWDREAGVAWVELGDGDGGERGEVVLGFGVCCRWVLGKGQLD
jgi:hypothetical protein